MNFFIGGGAGGCTLRYAYRGGTARSSCEASKERVGAKWRANYARLEDWHLLPGLVDRRPAVLLRNPSDPTGKLAYFILCSGKAIRSRTSEIFVSRATRLRARSC
jgi:hypothetical protein